MGLTEVKWLVIGVVSGAASGLFGVGGGIVMVPALTRFGGMDQRQAAATSLMALGPLALLGMLGYAVRGQVDLWLAVPMMVGSLIGGWLGAGLANRLSIRALRWIFIGVVLLAAVRLISAPGASTVALTHEVGRLIWLLPIGVAIGVLSALTGVGGGAVVVPTLQIGFGAPAPVAKGSSLLMILPAAVSGGWRNARSGRGSRSAAMWIGGVGAGVALVMAWLSVGLDPVLADVLFAVLLFIVVAQTLWADLRGVLRRR